MLVPVAAEETDALARGDAGGRAIAPGWPHDDTSAALGFIRSGGVQFLVVDEAGRIAGECGTKSRPGPDGSVEIGYGLAGPSRGRGLGGKAVAELVAWLEAQPDVRVIEAEVHMSNTPSRRVVENLGFHADDPPAQGYLRYRRAAQRERR